MALVASSEAGHPVTGWYIEDGYFMPPPPIPETLSEKRGAYLLHDMDLLQRIMDAPDGDDVISDQDLDSAADVHHQRKYADQEM